MCTECNREDATDAVEDRLLAENERLRGMVKCATTALEYISKGDERHGPSFLNAAHDALIRMSAIE